MKMMTTRLLYLVVLIAVFDSSAVQAAEEKILFDGVDITAFVDYYRPAVKTLEKSVTVFNWSTGASDPIWAEDFDPQNPQVTTNVRERSRSFWKNYGHKQGFTNAYGYGLYAAVDPVLTYGYGGSYSGNSKDWVLLQMELPVGFKMINLSEYPIDESTLDSKEKMQFIADQFKCPQNVQLNSFFQSGGLYVDSRCRKLIHQVFNKIFEIDGFTYSYDRVKFKACQAESIKSMIAFVITGQNWIRTENLKFFTAKTTSDREDRIRIQTLFLTGENPQNQLIFPHYSNLMLELASTPPSFVRRTKINCKAPLCEISADICKSQNSCKNVALDAFHLSTGMIMTSAAATKTEPRALLWPDMEGEKMSPAIHQWLQDNKFGCDGKVPY